MTSGIRSCISVSTQMCDGGGEVEITFEREGRMWAGFIREDHREGRP